MTRRRWLIIRAAGTILGLFALCTSFMALAPRALGTYPCRARLTRIFDLFAEDSWRISNDVGGVKTHLLRSGRRSRLS